MLNHWLVITIIVIEYLCAVDSVGDNLELIILHNNDMHSRFEETTVSSDTCGNVDKNKTCVGGFARTAHVIRKYRNHGEKNGKKVLYLNAGDTFLGTVWFSVYKSKICADFMNILAPDAMCIGNHEFDDGMPGLMKFSEEIKFPLLSANTNLTNYPSLERIKKSVILELNGTKIGIIGYTINDIQQCSSPQNISFSDELEAVQEESEKLDKEGVKIIIALGHAGFEVDKHIALNAPLVDVVVGGHSNTFLWNGPQKYAEVPEGPYPVVITQDSGRKVPVVQAYAYTKYLGILNTTFDENGDLIQFAGQPEYLGTDVPQDDDVLELLETFRGQVDTLNNQVIGESKVYLDGFFNSCRRHECNFGNLVTDAMVYHIANQNMETDYWTADASVGLYNSGNFRNSINVSITGGNVTKGELFGALPYPNDAISFSIKGRYLMSALEAGVRNLPGTPSGEYLQVSGLKVLYDLSKPVKQRVVSVQVRCANCSVPRYELLEPDRVYRIVTTDYLIDGGDGYEDLQKHAFDKKTLAQIPDIVEWYFRTYSPVYPEIQGRTRFVGSGAAKICNSVLFSMILFVISSKIFY